jgi:trimeric autotransporter adhesin
MRRFKLNVNAGATLTAIALLALTPGLLAQKVTTTAGGFVGDGGAATKASFETPSFVVQDKSGNLYISDFTGQRIRKVTPAGTITTYAGTGISGFSGDGGPAHAAKLSYPTGLVFDSAGDLIVADGGNNRVRMIDTTGKITTIAGTGATGYTGDGGPATKATFNQPWGVTYDSKGNLYITDLGNCAVRFINTSGIINTYAGNGTCGFAGDGGPAILANLNFPRGMVFDSSGNLYIADNANHRVRKVNTSGTISTFAGNGKTGFSGDGGAATLAKIGNPKGLVFRGGKIYIGNAGRSRIRTVTISTGIINTYAGSVPGYDGDGKALLSSLFFSPTGLLFDAKGKLLVADSFNQRVRRASSVMKTIAGGAIRDGSAATSAALVQPEAIAFDKSGNYYIADAAGNRIRKVSSSGTITTVAGTGVSGYSGDGGNATSATLWYPLGVALDSSGNLYIADDANGVIRKVNTSGTISTFATNAGFNGLGAMAADSSNNLYVVDQISCVVWEISPAAVVNVFAGNGVCGFSGDGGPATQAELNIPAGVAVDKHGNLFIADWGNNRVRVVDTGGVINTFAGNGTCGFSGDGGPATSAELCAPIGVAVTSKGTVYIADELNLRIRKVASGIITTYAGSGVQGYNGDGLPALGTNLDDPVAVVVNSSGIPFLVDDFTMRVRKIH